MNKVRYREDVGEHSEFLDEWLCYITDIMLQWCDFISLTEMFVVYVWTCFLVSTTCTLHKYIRAHTVTTVLFMQCFIQTLSIGGEMKTLGGDCRMMSQGPKAPCGFWGCKNRPTPFLAGCYTRWLNQALCVSYFSMLYVVLLFIVAPVVYFCCYVLSFWLLLSCQYLPSDWLERLIWGSLTNLIYVVLKMSAIGTYRSMHIASNIYLHNWKKWVMHQTKYCNNEEA